MSNKTIDRFLGNGPKKPPNQQSSRSGEALLDHASSNPSAPAQGTSGKSNTTNQNQNVDAVGKSAADKSAAQKKQAQEEEASKDSAMQQMAENEAAKKSNNESKNGVAGKDSEIGEPDSIGAAAAESSAKTYLAQALGQIISGLGSALQAPEKRAEFDYRAESTEASGIRSIESQEAGLIQSFYSEAIQDRDGWAKTIEQALQSLQSAFK